MDKKQQLEINENLDKKHRYSKESLEKDLHVVKNHWKSANQTFQKQLK